MSQQGFSRRYFFYGSLLAGAIPRGGFGSTPSLKAAGYKSPNEKLNLAAIGAGGQPAADLQQAHAGTLQASGRCQVRGVLTWCLPTFPRTRDERQRKQRH